MVPNLSNDFNMTLVRMKSLQNIRYSVVHTIHAFAAFIQWYLRRTKTVGAVWSKHMVKSAFGSRSGSPHIWSALRKACSYACLLIKPTSLLSMKIASCLQNLLARPNCLHIWVKPMFGDIPANDRCVNKNQQRHQSGTAVELFPIHPEQHWSAVNRVRVVTALIGYKWGLLL